MMVVAAVTCLVMLVILVMPNTFCSGAGVAVSNNNGEITIIPLDTKMGKEVQNIVNLHTEKVIKDTHNEIQRSLANSQKFASELQSKIHADIQRSLAQAFGKVGSPWSNFGIDTGKGGLDSTISKFQDDMFSGIQNSIASSQRFSENLRNNLNDVLNKAAASGKVKVVKANGKGPVVLTMSGGNDGSTAVVSGDADGLTVSSNVPVIVNGSKQNPK